jgi:5-methylcytosine-specific restriction endonuclease McrA
MTNRKQVISTSQMANLKKKWISKNPPDKDGNYTCWLCKQPVALENLSLDHVASVAEYPEYAFELSNLRPSHVFCNNERAFPTLQVLRGRKILRRTR